MKTPKFPRRTRISFIYRSNQYLNFVSVSKKTVTFYLWDEVSENPNYIMEFPRVIISK